MSADDNLPVILVSAVDAAAASEIISEIIEDGSSGAQAQCNGVCGAAVGAAGAVWELRNKYYSARVRLLPLVDGAAPAHGQHAQAHIIYLTEDETADAAPCAARGAAAAAAVARHGVRLLAARAAGEPPGPAAWARAQRYEAVPLLAPPPAPDAELVAEPRGVARLREALHAHVWPGMRRAPATPARPLDDARDSDSESSESSWGSWTEAAAEAGAERFADALALLPARRPAAAHGDDDATRRLQAEQLVEAFCRALGHELRLDGDGDGGGAGQ